MIKKVVSLLIALVMVFAMVCTVDAKAAEAGIKNANTTSGVLKSNRFVLYIDVDKTEGDVIPSDLRFNIFSESGEWLQNKCVRIEKSGRVSVEFQVPEYESGAKFQIAATTGVKSVGYCGTKYELEKKFIVDTYAYRDENGAPAIYDCAYISAQPFQTDPWKKKAEDFVNSRKIKSDTSYLVWVSKANYTVSVFLPKDGKWECIKYFGCSIGAPKTQTITGEYQYIQYQKKWDYGTYYCGPIMRFYRGYAIHSTLLNYDGTDYDGRIGKMISHGCVRVRPENIKWLVDYVPLKSKIYVTNE